MSGHLVLTTLHAHNAAAAITRLHELGVPGGLIAGSLNCIVSQRLARRLCPSTAVRQGLTTLRSHGFRLVREGICSLEEIRRVTDERLA